eukprot:TRINITY_DN11029_c0_g1_i1.p1 TRINITY_DN11029_c0_g1~~TRINITY_DN11029_c0_g1_i1.p1  ORF type:complete len:203 (-),score=32.71 TRINITY_DN11029_c0_g1_i1:237-845(-)
MEVEALSEVMQSILTATHQQDIPLRSRPRIQVREAAFVLKKVLEDYVDTRTIMIQVSPSIVPDDNRIIRQAINTNGGDYVFTEEVRKMLVRNADLLLDASEALIALMGPPPSQTMLIDTVPASSESSEGATTTTTTAAPPAAMMDITRRVALGVASQYLKENPDATLEDLDAELERRSVRRHIPQGKQGLSTFLKEAGFSVS